MPDRFDKFTERARHVLTYAQEESQRFNHHFLGTEHLLLGLLREEDSVAVQVLRNSGVEPGNIRSAVAFIIGRGDKPPGGEIGLTPRAKKVIELAVAEARQLNHSYIGTEHLLLGLIREGEGIAYGVLESMGVSLERVRLETSKLLSTASGDEHGSTVRSELLDAERQVLEAMVAFDSLQATDISAELSRTLIAPLLKELADSLDTLAYRPLERAPLRQATRIVQLLDEAADVFERHGNATSASLLRMAAKTTRTAIQAG